MTCDLFLSYCNKDKLNRHQNKTICYMRELLNLHLSLKRTELEMFNLIMHILTHIWEAQNNDSTTGAEVANEKCDNATRKKCLHN